MIFKTILFFYMKLICKDMGKERSIIINENMPLGATVNQAQVISNVRRRLRVFRLTAPGQG